MGDTDVIQVDRQATKINHDIVCNTRQRIGAPVERIGPEEVTTPAIPADAAGAGAEKELGEGGVVVHQEIGRQIFDVEGPRAGAAAGDEVERVALGWGKAKIDI